MSELVNIHWNICQHYNATHWYEQKPQPVAETDNAAILSDFAIHTDKKIHGNKPDITIKGHKNNSFIELMFPMDRNLSTI